MEKWVFLRHNFFIMCYVSCVMNIKVYSVIVSLKFLFLQWFLITRPCCFFSTKKNDEDFLLSGKGYGVEFCVFCDAIRVIISLDIFLAFNYYDQISFLKVEWHQVKFEVVHGCSEKQPLMTLFCRIYLLLKCMKLPKKWILIKYLFSLRPVHAMELMQMKPV